MNPGEFSLFRSVTEWTKRAMQIVGISPRDPNLRQYFAGPVGEAGVYVDETTALNFAAVWAAVTLLSSSLAVLPVNYYRKRGDSSELVDNDDVASLLNANPNPELTPYAYAELTETQRLLWGDSFSEIERNNGGQPIAYWPIPSNRVEVLRNDRKEIVYKVWIDPTTPKFLPSVNVLHLPGLGFNGLTSYSPVGMARESLGLGLAAERFGARFFGSGAKPGAVVSYPGRLKPKARENLESSLQANYGGLEKSHRIALLEEGMKWHSIGVPPDDAQFLQTRQFQIEEVARWYNLPVHRLRQRLAGDDGDIENQSIDFLTYSLLPILVRREQEYNRKLVPSNLKRRYFYKHQIDEVHRVNRTVRYESHRIALLTGFKNFDEVRAEEGKPPIPDGKGKTFMVPANMVTLERMISGEQSSANNAKNIANQDGGTGDKSLQIADGNS